MKLKQWQYRHLTAALALVGLAAPLAMLGGCNSGGPSAASGSAAVAKASSVSVSVDFPPPGAGAARIDENTTAIKVDIWDATAQCDAHSTTPCWPTRSVVLERPANGGTVSAELKALAPGEAWVQVTQLTGGANNRTPLETVNVSAKLAEGQNSMTVTMIRAAWTLQTPIRFNKTLASDDTVLRSFSLMQGGYQYAPQRASDGVHWLGMSWYQALAKGDNLCRDMWTGSNPTLSCDQSQLGGGSIGYFNRHDGVDSSKSYALLTYLGDEMPPLRPGAQGRERAWGLFSVAPDGTMLGQDDDDSTTVSDPDILRDLRVAVTGANTIAGNMMEILFKSITASNRRCYSDWRHTQQIPCPAQSAKASERSGSAYRQALVKAIAQAQRSAGKAAANAQGCYIDLTLRYTDGDWVNTGPGSGFHYTEDIVEVVDVCLHPFTATASQLPQSDLQVSVNRVASPR